MKKRSLAVSIIYILSILTLVFSLQTQIIPNVNAGSSWIETDCSGPLDYNSSFNVNLTSTPGLIRLQLMDIYVTDESNDQIVRTIIDGEGWDSFGTSGAGSGEFSSPSGIFYDPTTQYFYIADESNHRIVKTKFDGSGWSSWGTPGTGIDEFSFPSDIQYDPRTDFI